MQAGPPDAKTGVQKAEDAEEELRRKSTQVMMLVIVLAEMEKAIKIAQIQKRPKNISNKIRDKTA